MDTRTSTATDISALANKVRNVKSLKMVRSLLETILHEEEVASLPDSLIVELEKRREMHKKGLGKTYSEEEVLSAARDSRK